MKLPLISLIIPMYNSEKYISECLDSAVGQTYENLQIVVVDDDSTDSSADIVKRYTEKNKSILYLKTKNGNAAKTRRDGIAVASGSLVCFLDSDDILDSRYIERLHETLETTGTDIAACGIKIFSSEAKPANRSRGKGTPYVIESNAKSFADHYHITKENTLTLQTVPCKLFKKALFSGIDYDVLVTNIFEDNFIMAQILQKVSNIGVAPEALYWYRQSTGTTSSNTILTKVDVGSSKVNAVEFFNYVVIEYCKKMLGDDPAIHRLRAEEFFNYARMVPDLMLHKNYLEEKVKLDTEQLERLSKQLEAKEAQINTIVNSKSYRIGASITKPARRIAKTIKK